MVLIDIIKPLSTVLSSAVNKSQQHQQKNSWERQELNPGLVGGEQVWYSLHAQFDLERFKHTIRAYFYWNAEPGL